MFIMLFWISLFKITLRVGDADNFRMVHLPLFNFLSKRLIDKKLTSNDTIHIRLAGVDAPEVSQSIILNRYLFIRISFRPHTLASLPNHML